MAQRKTKFNTRIDGLTEIKYPKIEHLEANMMVRCVVGYNRSYGIMIAQVDHEAGEVLVGQYVGGTLESWDWLPASVVKTAWMTKYDVDTLGGSTSRRLVNAAKR
jgi:hypothetical protein